MSTPKIKMFTPEVQMFILDVHSRSSFQMHTGHTPKTKLGYFTHILVSQELHLNKWYEFSFYLLPGNTLQNITLNKHNTTTDA